MTAFDNDIWVYLQTEEDGIATVSQEILGKAVELAAPDERGVTGVLGGDPENTESRSDEAIARGADGIIALEDALLGDYRPEVYADSVGTVVKKGEPDVLLFPATHNGIDLAGRLAVRLSAGLNADVVRLEIDDDGHLVGGVPAFAGGILAMVKVQGRPQMSTVRPGVFAALDVDRSREGTVERIDPGITEEDVVTEIEERTVSDRVDLPSADVVVCAGRGFGGDLTLAEDLVDELGATLGVTRPLCDEGLVPRDRQIGSTGFSLKADLAICAGISGSVYFTSGLDDVDTVIAINTDSDAPIFDHADYCIEGDLFEVLPALLDDLREMEVQA